MSNINHYAKNLSRNLASVIGILSESVSSPFKDGDEIMNPEAKNLLRNPKDRLAIDSAVQELKLNRSAKRKTVTLSNKENITIFVE